jgi:hypothetical protein
MTWHVQRDKPKFANMQNNKSYDHIFNKRVNPKKILQKLIEKYIYYLL